MRAQIFAAGKPIKVLAGSRRSRKTSEAKPSFNNAEDTSPQLLVGGL
jgi:hypothetical protein